MSRNDHAKKVAPTVARRATMALLIAIVFSASHAYSAIEGDTQTIGSLLDRNAQNPDRLIVRPTPKLEIDDAEKEMETARRAAIQHYERVIALAAAPAVRAESMRRAADLRLEFIDAHISSEKSTNTSQASLQQELSTAINLYKQLLKEYPDYSAGDFVLYQLARAYDLSEQGDNSIDTLRRLAVEYPQSTRLYESSFRAAEMLYLRKRYREAVAEYQRISGRESTVEFWWLAQYKQAWTYYQLSDYEAAVAGFANILNQLDLKSEISSLDDMLLAAPEDRTELLRDAVRGMSRAFSKYPSSDDINTYFSRGDSQNYFPLIYRGLAAIFSEEKRYTDAAHVYESFASLHPQHELAQGFSEQAVKSYQDGGFEELAVAGQEQYIASYGPESAVWLGDTLSDSHKSLVRQYMGEVVKFRHAAAQTFAASEPENARPQFSEVADKYLAIISAFPEDKEQETLINLYADALYDAARFADAAAQYGKLAYELEGAKAAGDAALAQVKSYRQWHESLKLSGAAEAEVSSAGETVFAAIAKFAASFPSHSQRSFVLLAGAEDYYALNRYDDVIAICQPLVDAKNWSDTALQDKALGLLADAYFAKEDFGNSETYYAALVPRLGLDNSERKDVAERRLAISVYRQAEVAREQGQARLAANLFQRAADLAKDKDLVAEAMFNAAGQLFEVKEWSQSATLLARFNAQFRGHSMALDADKMLATAYQKSSQLDKSAKVYERIALYQSASSELRRTAQLTAGKHYLSAGASGDGIRVLTSYLKTFPKPLDEAQKTRLMLAGLYPENSKNHLKWLRHIVEADQLSGENNAQSQLMAADASYKLAMVDVASANAIPLSLPIEKSLPRRRAAMEKAISSLMKSSSFGFSDITTLANYELGELYRKFATALMESEVPTKLDGDVLEQYMILLEEQAYPFEEKAIAEYESNMALVGEGVWTAGVRKSLIALATLAPAKYGKQPHLEKVYDSLY